MTDRYSALTVVLSEDIREDDAQAIINAICMIKHVLSVTPHVTDMADHIAEMRTRREYQNKIFEILKN